MDPVITSEAVSSGTEVRNTGESRDEAVVLGNSATLALSDTNLVCVEYPAVVNNVNRMLDSIGGEQGVSKVSLLPVNQDRDNALAVKYV